MTRFGICEWYGESFATMSSARRRDLAAIALREGNPPDCPFQKRKVPCSKRGGVCTLRRYNRTVGGEVVPSDESPVIVCPNRFDEEDLVIHWLAEIVGLDWRLTRIAREVPFMQSTSTGKTAGRIDLVLANDVEGDLLWYGLEIQAVYFSGPGMTSEFQRLKDRIIGTVPYPDSVRRPDWRSSSAKRLMPQLQIKVPTLRRWGTKLAVAVDEAFFDAIGGPSSSPIKDLDEGEVIWLVPRISNGLRLEKDHWETLSLDDSTKKLLSARTVNRSEFESSLNARLKPLVGY